MSRRDRPGSGATELAKRPASAAVAPLVPAASHEAAPIPRLGWDEFFRAIPAGQQDELLALAARQGILYAHQLPATTNGNKVSHPRSLLAELFAGNLERLAPVPIAAVEIADAELDAIQREAVYRAVNTPDICLIQGLPGTGKSRVLAEIVTAATAHGERVLLVAPSAAAVDQVLERVATRQPVLPIRCLASGERPESLSPAIRALTFDARSRSLASQAQTQARLAVQDAQQTRARLEKAASIWPILENLLNRWRHLDQQVQALQELQGQVPAEVDAQAEKAHTSADSSAFDSLLAGRSMERADVVAGIDKRVLELRGQSEAQRRQLESLTAQLGAWRKPIEAKRRGRWWSGAWWRATFQGLSPTKWDELEERSRCAQAEMDNLLAQVAALEKQRAQIESDFLSAKTQIIQAEITRRQEELTGRQQVLLKEQSLLRQNWEAVCGELECEIAKPAAISAEAVQEARRDWASRLQETSERFGLAGQWAEYLDRDQEMLAARLPDYINLVASPCAALSADPRFGDRLGNGSGGPVQFDLLVVDEADHLTEMELTQLARRARRWVLAGETPWESARTHEAEGDKPGSTKRHSLAPAPRAGAAAELRAPVFPRLWQLLHCDPRRLPYSWVYEGSRLCCRLRSVPVEQRQWLEREQVADYPDIELRILTLPRTQPALAEIVFPTSMPIDQAKQYVFQELQELAVWASMHSLRWQEEADLLVLRLADCHEAHGMAISLVPGIIERLTAASQPQNGASFAPVPWRTCCLEFDRKAGWHRARAEEWVREHLGLCDLGRTIQLDVLHRMERPLAAFMHGFFSTSSPALSGGPAAESAAAVEFVPVPALARTVEANRVRDARGPQAAVVNSGFSRRGGAGLEIDLADPRQQERLAPEFRGGLPNQGLVNRQEAEAVVRTLAQVLHDCSAAKIGRGAKAPQIAVVALYPAQAELLRRMIQQSPQVAALASGVEVGTPSRFRQCEADVVLLSLTRSHTHRAVAYGEGPQSLMLALTRARARLLIFGDPGTLLRRSQWEGPLEHLDEAAAAHERELIAHLVSYLDGHGLHQRAFHLRQGNGS